jgi:hypothetical protein
MPRHCATTTLGDGTRVTVCGSGIRACRFCGAVADYLCDAPRWPRARRLTCDAPLCGDCRAPQGRNRDYCPDHATAYQAPLPLVAVEPQ